MNFYPGFMMVNQLDDTKTELNSPTNIQSKFNNRDSVYIYDSRRDDFYHMQNKISQFVMYKWDSINRHNSRTDLTCENILQENLSQDN